MVANMSANDIAVLLDTLKSLDDVNILDRVFDTCLKLVDLFDSRNLSSEERLFQDAMEMCSSSLKKCICMDIVRDLYLFNSIEAVETSDIKYILVCALLGYSTLKLHSNYTEPSNRRIMSIAKQYFLDFLHVCKGYNLSKRELVNRQLDDFLSDEEVPRRQQPDLETVREYKIQQYKLMNDLRKREIELKPTLEMPGTDECIREYYLVIIEYWMLRALEELKNIDLMESLMKNEE